MVSNMIDERCLKFDVYDYLKYCSTHRAIRGVAVITDKQYIFYSQVLRDDYGTHNDIEIEIENAIHPNNIRYAWDAIHDNNAHIFAVGYKEFIIDLPDNGELSMTQLDFIFSALDQIKKYNSEQESEDKKVKLSVFHKLLKTDTHSDITALKEELKGMVTKKVTLDEEKIIGKTLSREKIRNNLIFHLELEKSTNISSLKVAISNYSKYCYDSYYKETFLSIFPNYFKVVRLIEIIDRLGITDAKIENATIDNIETILNNIIKNVFNDIKSYYDIFNISSRIKGNMTEDEIKTMFPNFELFRIFLYDISFVNEDEITYFNKQIESASSYEDVGKIVFKMGRENKVKRLNDLNYLLELSNRDLEKNATNKEIISHREELRQMIVQKQGLANELSLSEFDLKDVTTSISGKQTEIDVYSQILENTNKSFFKRIFSRKKIRNCINNINKYQIEKDNLETEKEKLELRINSLKEQISSIENKFKEMTKFADFPYSVDAFDLVCNSIKLLDENAVNERISDYRKRISVIESKLGMLENLGLLNNISDSLENYMPSNFGVISVKR